jgi:YfiR/HmsC-like
MFEGMKLVVLMLFVGSLRLCAQTSLPSGYQLKAAFLFNFVKFIDWPASSFANSQSPFTICVLGQDPFGSILEDTLQGKMIGDRSLTLRRLRDRAEVRLCQMVFVSSSERAHMAEIIAVVQGTGVLLVGETNGFAASGGTIEFTLEDNHVRFTINTDAADRSGLKFSSKLLAVAKIVHNGGI